MWESQQHDETQGKGHSIKANHAPWMSACGTYTTAQACTKPLICSACKPSLLLIKMKQCIFPQYGCRFGYILTNLIIYLFILNDYSLLEKPVKLRSCKTWSAKCWGIIVLAWMALWMSTNLIKSSFDLKGFADDVVQNNHSTLKKKVCYIWSACFNMFL